LPKAGAKSRRAPTRSVSARSRSKISRRALRAVLGLVKNLRIFDGNLRQQFYTPRTLRASFNLASVVKLNGGELPVVAEMLGINQTNPVAAAREMLAIFGLKLVCITRGADGSVLVTKKGVYDHAGFKIEIADAVGAGDAFTAALAHGLLRRWDLFKTNEFANRVGAFVASQSGAMPAFPEEFKQ
jgi:fructokinase